MTVAPRPRDAELAKPALRIACMVSGPGTTVMNLADRIERGELPVQIVLVAATKAGTQAITRAAERALPTMVIATDDSPARSDAASPPAAATRTMTGERAGRSRSASRSPQPAMHALQSAIDDSLDRALRLANPDLICLCGYMRLFRVGPWGGRVINIHPGPLPQFGGKGMFGSRVHRAVLDAGLHETRCCVHLVDSDYDRGPVIAERRVMVLPADTPESLEARVRAAELELLPEVLLGIARGEIDLQEIALKAGRSDLSSGA